jgi:Fe-Mn family superoxide dismutase
MIKPFTVSLSLCLAVLVVCASPVLARPAPSAAQASIATFVLEPLPYAPEALEPAIDAETMRIHHGRHHKAYVDNLNAAIAADPALAGLSLEQLMARMSTLPVAVRNNGGGHWNHALFWRLMAPVGQGGEPSAALAAAITRDFGSMDAFKVAFNRAATSRFGSGWAWLIVRDGQLEITSTPNQDNPLMDLSEVRGAPILAVDVWEHAYYLNYQNRRADYLTAWWSVVNWNEVNRLFDATQG